MNKFFFVFGIVTALFSVPYSEANDVVVKTEKNSRLDLEFRNLEELGRSQRIRSGVGGIIAGSVFGVLAVNGDGQSSGDRTFLGVVGGLSIGSGIYSLLSKGLYEKSATEYFSKSGSDQSLYGEHRLQELSDSDRTKRIIRGVSSGVFGLGLIIWGATMDVQSNDVFLSVSRETIRPVLYIAGGLSLGMSLVTLLVRSPAERSRERYFGSPKTSGFNWNLGISPDGKGPALFGQLRF